ARFLMQDGSLEEAEQMSRRTVELSERLVAVDPKYTQLRRNLATQYFTLSEILRSSGDFDGSAHALQRAMEERMRVADGENPALGDLRDLTAALLTVQPEHLRNPRKAQQYARRAVELTHNQDAECLASLGDADWALEQQRDAALAWRAAMELLP